tara:strand:+ start:1599 stop:3242 length:1644 start_codon:yes stop_codon:yes gene_type:complete
MYFNRKHLKRDFSSWSLLLVTISVIIALPILTISLGLLKGVGEMWNHIATYFLIDYISNSLFLIIGCGALSFFLGVSSAWIITNYHFKGRKLIEWLLFMPLSIPSYIVAYSYVGMFGNGGSLILFLNKIGLNIQKIEMMNIGGLIWVLSFSLFPYVYAASRAVFISIPSSIKETTLLLGSSKSRFFLKIALPISSPAIIGGLFLVCMEVLNDYGAAKYYGINTFTTGIFRTWTALEDLQSSIYLSGMLVLLVFIILSFVKWLRRNKSYNLKLDAENNSNSKRETLHNNKKIFYISIVLIPIIFGFLIPLTQLIIWAKQTFYSSLNMSLINLTVKSLLIAFLTSFLVVLIALILIYFSKWNLVKKLNLFPKIATIGYVIPGAIIGIAIIRNSQTIINFFDEFFNLKVGFLFYSSSIVLIYAYIFRFLAVGFNSIESNTLKFGKYLSESSYLLGFGKLKTLFKIDLPLLKTTLVGAFILVFIDVLKELPLTLLLKPYNLQTLAVQAYAYAEDEQVAESALPALLLIIVVGILISIFNYSMSKFNLKSKS